MTRRRAILVAFPILVAAGLAIWLTEGPRAATETPRLPFLGGVEPAVEQLLRSRHAAVLAAPTAASWAAYGRALNAHEMNREAEHAYAVAAGLTPEAQRFELLYLAGQAASGADLARAREWFEKALVLNARYVPLLLRLGQIYERECRGADAGRLYRRASVLQPSSDALLGEGRVALAAGRIAEAISLLEKAASLDPEHREVYGALAQGYARMGRKQDAARAAAEAGDFAQPRSIVDPILTDMRREAVSAVAINRLGIGLMRGRHPREALAVFDRAAALAPDNLEFQLDRARALVMLKRFDEALAILDRVVLHRPDDAMLWLMRGSCLASDGRSQEAIEAFRRALELDPRSEPARYNLAYLLTSVDPVEAMEHLRLLLLQRPDRADARLCLALIHHAKGRLSEAQLEIDRVLAREPGHAGALAMRKKLNL